MNLMQLKQYSHYINNYYDSNNVKSQVCTSAFKFINTTLTLNGTTRITIFEGAPQDFSPYSVDCHTIDIN